MRHLSFRNGRSARVVYRQGEEFAPIRFLLCCGIAVFTFVMGFGWTKLAQAAQSATEATPEQPRQHPKICLVLSGGGARGAAHVGVL